MSEHVQKGDMPLGESIKIGQHGFVQLIDVMGNDGDIAAAARTSFGAGTKSVRDDEALIRYLMRNRHTSPFEMAEMKFLIKIPMDAWRQMIRHRTASVNEYSTRYSEAIDQAYTVREGDWRQQSDRNKQGSSGQLVGPREQRELAKQQSALQNYARTVYQNRLDAGVAREQARMDLPLSTYTQAVWKIDLHNLLHFLRLRLDSHAQQEIREYAQAIYSLARSCFPITCVAFRDFVLDSYTLSYFEIQCLQAVVDDDMTLLRSIYNNQEVASKREKEEFLEFASKRLDIDLRPFLR